MLTIYHIYPYSESPLREFSLMQQLPSQQDMARFADVVSSVVESDENSIVSGDYRQSELWLPEGIVDAEQLLLPLADRLLAATVELHISVNKELQNALGSHDFFVTLEYSQAQLKDLFRQQVRGNARPRTDIAFNAGPNLTDLGVDDSDQDFASRVDSVLALRLSETVGSLDMRKGTLTEDPAVAELRSRSAELINELSVSGELTNFVDAEYLERRYLSSKETACSQRTLQMSTKFMEQFLIK